MKIKHRVPVFPPRPAVIDADYQADLDRMTAKAEKVYLSALRSAERAERRACRDSANAETRDAAVQAREAVTARYDELRRLDTQMRQTPAGGVRHSGRGSVRRVHNGGTM